MHTAEAIQMRAIRLKAAKHIHAQKKKDGALPAEDVFKESDCDMADIVDGGVYYALNHR